MSKIYSETINKTQEKPKCQFYFREVIKSSDNQLPKKYFQFY